ncbi:MAG: glycosyltransferase [Betaproteobacteria bacterium]|nr:MAG: glycosyltransferase [Betaproteobacteria bacterium]
MAVRPLVSVITPSYQQGEFIEATIESVKAQTYPNVEHIVIDAGSTDETTAILGRYDGSYDLKWISEPDRGQADAIRKGFASAKGSILCWLNSDDTYVTPTVIGRVVDYFSAFPDADVVCGGGICIDKGGRWIKAISLRPERVNSQALNVKYDLMQPAVFFRRSVAERISLDVNLHFAFDWVFFRDASLQFNFLPVTDTWATYRAWGENKSQSGGYRRALEILEVQRRFVGRCSWRYWVVAGFVGLHAVAAMLPAGVRPSAHAWVSKSSFMFSSLLRHRVTPV